LTSLNFDANPRLESKHGKRIHASCDSILTEGCTIKHIMFSHRLGQLKIVG
jgi:hypothetical protein